MTEGKLGLSINTLMREVLIEHGIPYGEACKIVDRFATTFDKLSGTDWLEVNGTTEWRLTYDGRATSQIPHLSEDYRKGLGLPAECPCGKSHVPPKKGGDRPVDEGI